MRALLICPWFGPRPPWWEHYIGEILRLNTIGYDLITPSNVASFAARARDVLGVEAPIIEGGSKIHDYRPALGLMYAPVIFEGGYQWWGHTDLDCVYGRLDRFVTEDKLAACDVYSDCAHDYLSGPLTLYRVGATERLFQCVPDWRFQLERPQTSGWVETSFSDACRAEARVTVENHHAWKDPWQLERLDDGTLLHGQRNKQREIAYYHFRNTKEWPL